jgi:histidyl-tRNA synthetase
VVILGGDEIEQGRATVKDLDAGRARAGDVADNAAWKAERPGQVSVARGDLVATLRPIVEEASRNPSPAG